MKLAIFDLDNTLLGGDSDHAWGEYLIHAGMVDAQEHRARNDEFYRQYLQGGLDMTAYVEFAVAPIAGLAPERLQTLHAEFMKLFVEPMMLPKAGALIESHKQQGDYCLIITATNRFITAPIAELLGVHDLIATELQSLNGVYTGRIDGTPSFQAGKVSKLHNWLERQNRERADRRLSLENSVFYSDSFNDLPLLEQVSEAVAVDPDDTLRKQAEQRGWKIMSLR